MSFVEFQKFCRDNHLALFTIKDLRILLNEYSEPYLRLKLSRWKEKGYITRIKNGLYQLRDATVDEFEIAASLITPGYVSLESALSHYSIIPDVSGPVTSITTKNTRYFTIHGVQYDYYHIKTALFADYHSLRGTIFIASPQKAILDFFYFRKPTKDHQFFERLNPEILKNFDMRKMEQMALKYPSQVQKLTNYFKHVTTR